MKTLLPILAICLITCGVRAESRSWTSTSGSTLEAEFTKEAYGNVYLKKADGKLTKIPFAKLSEADQTWLMESGKITSAALKQKYAAKVKATAAASVSSYVKDLLDGELTDNAGKEVDIGTAMGGKKKIAYYFSASWCPPCKAFTPKLIDAYEKYNGEGGDLEIILVGSDRDKKSHLKYLDHMPWLSVEFGGDAHKAIKNKFQVRGIPTLIVVDENGEVLDAGARNTVASSGAKAFEKL